jgi:hypothetical protein
VGFVGNAAVRPFVMRCRPNASYFCSTGCPSYPCGYPVTYVGDASADAISLDATGDAD